MRALRLIVVILLLGLVVAPVWASAQGHRFESSTLLDRLGSFLTSLWSAAGCAIAPWERCLDGAAPAGDEGPVIDPDGLHSNVAGLPAGDAGPAIDPWGVAGH